MNPYHVLDVAPGADNATVVRAMATAMKARKYPAHVLAEAQRTLLSPERRLVADFLLPALPVPRRFSVPPEPSVPGELPEWPYEDFDALARAATALAAQDLAEAEAAMNAPAPDLSGVQP